MEQIVERLLALPPKELLDASIGIGIGIGIMFSIVVEICITVFRKYIHIG